MSDTLSIRITREQEIDQRAVIRRVCTDRIEGFEEALVDTRNTCENVDLVHVITAQQVHAMLADVVELKHVVLGDLTLEADRPRVDLRKLQIGIDHVDRAGSECRRLSRR